MLELVGLLIGIVILLIWIRMQESQESQEFFEDASYLAACPPGYTVMHPLDGTTTCCDGEIAGQVCLGAKPCILNGKSSTLPQCMGMIQQDYKNKGETKCPPSLPNYYEDKKIKGCTSGPLNPTMTGPKTTQQPSCTMYPSMDDNLTSMDSCQNQKDKEDYPCFGTNCTTQLIQPSAKTPVLLSVSFTDTDGIPHVAYTRASMERYLDAIKPGWREKGVDLSKNLAVAEVAKAVYIDRTMSFSEIQSH